jgi:hypothetical protein
MPDANGLALFGAVDRRSKDGPHWGVGAPPGIGRGLRPPATQPVVRCATFVCRQEGPTPKGGRCSLFIERAI